MAKAQAEAVSEVRAQAKWVRCSARKARLVLDTIRGRTVPEARTVLAFSTRDVAREIDKVLRSAVANAEANHGFYGDNMVVSACYADEGPRLKRWKPRARGRADRIVKGSCHITIKLTSIEAEAYVKSTKPAAPGSERVKPAPSAPAVEALETTEAAASETETSTKQSEAKPKAPKKAAAKPRAKKTDQGEAKPKAATRRAPKSKKAEE